MIVLAAIFILYSAVEKWMAGLQLENLGAGTVLVLAAGVLNAGLGWYLIRMGRRTRSLILEANGKHVLTDSWTSFGVVAVVMLTGWKPFDPLLAIAVAINILWAGGHLVRADQPPSPTNAVCETRRIWDATKHCYVYRASGSDSSEHRRTPERNGCTAAVLALG
jgi:hypothetical protein